MLFNEEVRFLVKPTVAVALTVSNRISIAFASIVADNKSVDMNTVIKDIVITDIDLFIICFGIFRLKISASFLFRIVAIADKIRTTKVTVFTPPAVPTGEPPINIRIIDINIDGLVKFSCGILANPAVLVVID